VDFVSIPSFLFPPCFSGFLPSALYAFRFSSLNGLVEGCHPQSPTLLGVLFSSHPLPSLSPPSAFKAFLCLGDSSLFRGFESYSPFRCTAILRFSFLSLRPGYISSCHFSVISTTRFCVPMLSLFRGPLGYLQNARTLFFNSLQTPPFSFFFVDADGVSPPAVPQVPSGNYPPILFPSPRPYLFPEGF